MFGSDFTSALYLGLTHPSRELPKWSALTTGAPAALREAHVARSVGASVAALVGAESGIVAPSTLHASLDLFRLLAGPGGSIYADASLYAIGAWGVDHAALHGVRVHRFAAHSPRALRDALERDAPFARPPIVVTDGLCPSCARAAPLIEYVRLTREHHGMLIVDDTQALGVLGACPDARQSFGYGGGGSLRHFGIGGPDVVVLASLAKGLGVPVAVIAGSAAVIRLFRREAPTRAHCSPPSIPALLAAERALRINASRGDMLRDRLHDNVARFLACTIESDLLTSRWHFPVQSIRIPRHADARSIHRTLAHDGIRPVLTRGLDGRAAATFLITAAHSPAAVDRAASRTVSLLESRSVLPRELANAV